MPATAMERAINPALIMNMEIKTQLPVLFVLTFAELALCQI